MHNIPGQVLLLASCMKLLTLRFVDCGGIVRLIIIIKPRESSGSFTRRMTLCDLT